MFRPAHIFLFLFFFVLVAGCIPRPNYAIDAHVSGTFCGDCTLADMRANGNRVISFTELPTFTDQYDVEYPALLEKRAYFFTLNVDDLYELKDNLVSYRAYKKIELDDIARKTTQLVITVKEGRIISLLPNDSEPASSVTPAPDKK